MVYDARAAANFILEIAACERLALTPMAIQKTLYYAHGWHLAQTGTPLLKQEFEAWDFGPVIGCVYSAFKKSGRDPVSAPATWFDPLSETVHPWFAEFDEDAASLLRSVVLAYGHIDAYELSQMTHRAGGPWDQVWNMPDKKISLGMKISNCAIRDDFLYQKAENAPGDRTTPKIPLVRLGGHRSI
jgi:uncharacterized phage-associated protein